MYVEYNLTSSKCHRKLDKMTIRINRMLLEKSMVRNTQGNKGTNLEEIFRVGHMGLVTSNLLRTKESLVRPILGRQRCRERRQLVQRPRRKAQAFSKVT